MSGVAEEVPYLVETSLELNHLAAAQLTGEVREAGDADEILLHGACPKCAHFTETIISTDPYVGTPPGTSKEDFAVAPRRMRLVVDCRCLVSHPNADGKRGCGRCWEVMAAWTGREGIVQLTPSPSLAECQAAEELRALTTSELSRVRKAAESWRTGLAGLLTLVTTVAFVKGRDTISEIHSSQRIAVGALLGLALASAAVAALLAMQGAYGSLYRSQLSEGGLRGLLDQESNKALRALRWTRRLTVASLALIVAGIGVTWYGTKAPSVPPAYIQATTADGTKCGELVGLSGGNILLQQKKLLPAVRIPLTKLTDLDVVETCS